MPLHFDRVDSALFDVYKVQTCSGKPLEVITASGGANYILPAGVAGDAFGRLRVSNPTTLFDSQHRYQENDKWSNVISGSASTTYVADESAVNLTVTAASGDAVYRESKKVFPYQPGKSLLVFASHSFADDQTNLRQRVGYFGTENGVYFEKDGEDLFFVLRSNVSGSVVNTRVAQTSWNGDKLDGNGASGVTLNASRANILWMDLEWLGVGDVRCGFVINGELILCHTFRNTNTNNSTYMTTAALPLRQEIETTDTVVSGTSAKQICNTVISEGGYQVAGDTYSVDRGTTNASLDDAGTTYPVITLRLNSSRLDSVVVPQAIEAVVTSNANIRWSLIKNATLSGASYSTHSNGNVDFDITATGLSGGTTVAAGYLEKRGQINFSGPTDFTYQLGRTASGVSDTLTVAAEPTTNNTDVLFAVKWVEML